MSLARLFSRVRAVSPDRRGVRCELTRERWASSRVSPAGHMIGELVICVAELCLFVVAGASVNLDFAEGAWRRG